LVVAWALAAHAQHDVEIVLEYKAPAACPTSEDFLARLRLHTEKARPTTADSEDAVHLHVEVRNENGIFRGSVKIEHAGRSSDARKFEGSDCREVAAALALTSALSIDPEASVAPDSNAEPISSADELGREPAPSQPERMIVPKLDDAERRRAAPKLTEAAWQFSVGAELASSWVFDPTSSLGAAATASFRKPDGRIWLPMELLLDLEYVTTRPVQGSNPVLLDLATARLGYCPFRVDVPSTLLFCGTGQGGLVAAQGTGVEAPRRARRDYWSLGAGIRGRVFFSFGWELAARADLAVSLVSRSFAVEPGPEVVAETRPISLTFALGARYVL
jgi:hypothetical protein